AQPLGRTARTGDRVRRAARAAPSARSGSFGGGLVALRARRRRSTRSVVGLRARSGAGLPVADIHLEPVARTGARARGRAAGGSDAPRLIRRNAMFRRFSSFALVLLA